MFDGDATSAPIAPARLAQPSGAVTSFWSDDCTPGRLFC
jgi:hypothetical protein